MAGGYQRITMSDQDPTPFGRVLLAGEVSDAEPLVPGPLHALPGTVISLVTHAAPASTGTQIGTPNRSSRRR